MIDLQATRKEFEEEIRVALNLDDEDVVVAGNIFESKLQQC